MIISYAILSSRLSFFSIYTRSMKEKWVIEGVFIYIRTKISLNISTRTLSFSHRSTNYRMVVYTAILLSFFWQRLLANGVYDYKMRLLSKKKKHEIIKGRFVRIDSQYIYIYVSYQKKENRQKEMRTWCLSLSSWGWVFALELEDKQ
jgi:hypothetical protein